VAWPKAVIICHQTPNEMMVSFTLALRCLCQLNQRITNSNIFAFSTMNDITLCYIWWHTNLRLATNLLSDRFKPLRARQLSHMKPDGHKCSKYSTQILCTARPHSLHSMNL